MQFIGGAGSSSNMATRGLAPVALCGRDRCRESVASCLIADHRGEVVGNALTFRLNEPGVRALEAELKTAAAPPCGSSVRTGWRLPAIATAAWWRSWLGLPLSQCDHFA